MWMDLTLWRSTKQTGFMRYLEQKHDSLKEEQPANLCFDE